MLPLGDSGKAAKQVFSVLHETNRLALDQRKRVLVFDTLADLGYELLEDLHRQLTNTPAPGSQNSQHLAELIVRFHYEFALAYRCLLAGKNRRHWYGPQRRKLEAKTLQHSLFHLNGMLRTACQARRVTRSDIWRMAYALYSQATRLGVQSVAVSCVDGNCTRTVEETFKGMLLLGFSSPMALHSCQLSQLTQALPALAEHVYLLSSKKSAEEKNLFFMALESHATPFQLHRGTSYIQGTGNSLLLDTRPLVKHLTERLNPDQKREELVCTKGELSQATIEILLRNFDSCAERYAPRVMTQRSSEILLGFSSVCSAIGRENTPAILSKKVVGSALRDPMPTIENLSTMTSLDELTLSDTSQVDMELSIRDTHWKQRVPKPLERRISGLVLNESDQGFCLSLPWREGAWVHVGELVAVQSPSGRRGWHIGSIAWSQITRGELILGVQVFTSNGLANSGRAEVEDERKSSFDCILLPKQQGRPAPSRLLAEPMKNQGVDQVIVQQGEERLPMSILGVISRTNSYVEYHVEHRPDVESAPQQEINETAEHRGKPVSHHWWDVVSRTGCYA
ncbi:MAG: hypothetical protein RPU61_09495 [Candidatus Sedimenticola sp. (ex Thyasira tokunagai)]